MKVKILQFSGTGNTWYVARCLQEIFREMGVACDLYSIESLEDADACMESADVVGLGYPIYGSDFPEPVMDLLDGISSHVGKRAFVYCTQMMFSGDGAAMGARRLRRKGFIVRQLMHVHMPNNITDYRIVRWKRPTRHDRLQRRVNRKAKRMATAVIKDKRLRKGEGFGSLLLGLLQRLPFKRYRKTFKNALKIDATCTGCGTCVDLCPSQNLTMSESLARAGEDCYLCYRCINHCPVGAIRFAKRSRVKRPYRGPTEDFAIGDVRIHHEG